jgi:deoxyribodipyrimidine photolyase
VEARNEPEQHATSGLSPYLHFGHISAHQIFSELTKQESSAVSILRSWILRFESEYLSDQIFFNPFPEDLMALDVSARGRP